MGVGVGKGMHRVRHRDRSCLRVKVLCSQALSQVRLFATPWTIALKAPWDLSMASSSQENWSGLPFPSPGDLPHPGTEPSSTALAGGFFTTVLPGKAKSKRDEGKYEIWPKYSPLQGVRGRVWEGQGNGAEK